MRGDRPYQQFINAQHDVFTPHARGSTAMMKQDKLKHLVYPACAGIDLGAANKYTGARGLPRMRGDRPRQVIAAFPLFEFTPHARGSTLLKCAQCGDRPVYPACAGIDPVQTPVTGYVKCLPRMRGDRPRPGVPGADVFEFTPHARGSTPLS